MWLNREAKIVPLLDFVNITTVHLSRRSVLSLCTHPNAVVASKLIILFNRQIVFEDNLPNVLFVTTFSG
jgi:hypothetical protein